MKKKAGINQPATKQDVTGLKQDVGGLKKDVTGLKQDVSGLKHDVSGLKHDVYGLKHDVSDIKQDVVSLKKGFGDLRNELSAYKIAIELKLDDQQEQTKGLITGFKDEILSAVDGVMKEIQDNREERRVLIGRTFESVERLDDHESRIKILEQPSPAVL